MAFIYGQQPATSTPYYLQYIEEMKKQAAAAAAQQAQAQQQTATTQQAQAQPQQNSTPTSQPSNTWWNQFTSYPYGTGWGYQNPQPSTGNWWNQFIDRHTIPAGAAQNPYNLMQPFAINPLLSARWENNASSPTSNSYDAYRDYLAQHQPVGHYPYAGFNPYASKNPFWITESTDTGTSGLPPMATEAPPPGDGGTLPEQPLPTWNFGGGGGRRSSGGYTSGKEIAKWYQAMTQWQINRPQSG